MDWVAGDFEWDRAKELANAVKHGVDFTSAQDAFYDPNRVIAHDPVHSTDEPRFYCYGKIDGHVLTVRFVLHAGQTHLHMDDKNGTGPIICLNPP